jgi:hypothetical protein
VLAGRLHPLPLAGGTGTEILSWLDDHSRYALSVTAHVRVTGPLVLAAFRAACDRYGANVGIRSSGWKQALQAFTIYFDGRIPTP